ncbi:outer membrane protein assembly factor BamE [Zoogloea sp.]|uniref:outer membrane protein assembly factor BamE n=1 Tax=Zoogloea sp. TaxID=49181 RepID=UPI0032206152
MRTLLTSAFLVAALAGCSTASDFFKPYRIDVRQGNFVSQDMVAQLKPGMSREQVRFVLGAPLLVDVFHSDRWDYVYRFQPGKGRLQERRLTVIFENGSLARLEGDVRADEAGAQ